IKAELEPLYRKFEDWCVNGTVESAVNLYHSQGVMVNKGVNATYGRTNITRKYNVMWSRLHSHIFKIHDGGSYQGTKDYRIAEFIFDLLRGEFRLLTGKFTHIWKKEGDEWRIYHEEYEKLKGRD
uniref:SnoaL-like domain-containing protein n=1 Tax=Haemonchus contortus TaxID=6289 RepID=A0A7I4YW90_HAECO